MTMTRALIYTRVSTNGQTTENQERELREVAEQRGWKVLQVLADNGVSGAKGRAQRPGLDEALTLMTRGKADVLMAWSVDRLGRSLADLVSSLAELQACGGNLYLHQQGLDTATPAGRAMFQMAGVFAEFERAMIQERIKSGMARAKAQGRKIGRPKTPLEIRNQIVSLAARGISKREVARRLDIPRTTVRRILQEEAK